MSRTFPKYVEIYPFSCYDSIWVIPMKDIKHNIILLVCFLAMCAFQYYDTDCKFSFLAAVPWALGLYFLYRSLKPSVVGEVDSLKSSGNAGDFVCAFVTSSASIAILTSAVILGFTGKFYFNMALIPGSFQDETFFSFLFSCALSAFGLCMMMFVVYFVFSFVFSIAFNSNKHASFGNTLTLYACAALIISHFCGIINILELVFIVSSIFTK